MNHRTEEEKREEIEREKFLGGFEAFSRIMIRRSRGN